MPQGPAYYIASDMANEGLVISSREFVSLKMVDKTKFFKQRPIFYRWADVRHCKDLIKGMIGGGVRYIETKKSNSKLG